MPDICKVGRVGSSAALQASVSAALIEEALLPSIGATKRTMKIQLTFK